MVNPTEVIYDPHLSQSAVLHSLEDRNVPIVDATSPFVMLLESVVSVTADALQEMSANNARIHSSLSRTQEDLYHHMTMEEEIHMFASPASAEFTFSLSRLDIETNGVYDKKRNQYHVTIPKDTVFEVENIKFTLLNNINVFVILTDKNGTPEDEHKGTSFVEEEFSEHLFSLNGVGNIQSAIVVDPENIEWVVFTVRLYQIERSYFEDTVIDSIPWIKKIPLEHGYYFSRLTMKHDGTDTYVPVKLTHSDKIFDPNELTLQVIIGESTVTYTIPNNYVVAGLVAGRMRVELFTTRGKMNKPLKQFTTEDYLITYPNRYQTEAAAAIEYVALAVQSMGHIDGGVERRRFKDLRNKIIYRTGGVNELPITEKQLHEHAKVHGFSLQKVLDVVTERTYVADKAVVYDSDDISTPEIDLYTNRTIVDVVSLSNNRVKSFDNDLMIQSGCIFEEKNGMISPINSLLITDLDNMSRLDRIKYVNEHKLLTTPFHYMLDKTATVMDVRVYDLDHPMIDDLEIINKNVITDVNVNLGSYFTHVVNRMDGTTDYEIFIELFGNDEFKSYIKDHPENIHVMLMFDYPNSDKKTYIHGEYVNMNGIWNVVFRINSTQWVDERGNINLNTGYSPIGTNLTTPLESTVTAVIYGTKKKDAHAGSTYEPTSYITFDPTKPKPAYVMAFTYQKFKFSFGKHLKYLWSMMTSAYTPRKYELEDFDVPVLLGNDVYKVDAETGCEVSIVKDADGHCTDVKFDIEHPKGEAVKDANGNPIRIKTKGARKLDPVTHQPVINFDAGVVRYVDLFLYDYRYQLVHNTLQEGYRDNTLELVRNWLTHDLVEMNKVTLEQTTILFKPRRTFGNVKTIDRLEIPHIVKPVVTLYVDRTLFTYIDTDNMLFRKIGHIMARYLGKSYIDVTDLCNEIEGVSGTGVSGVKVEGLDPANRNIVALDKTSGRLSLAKKLSDENMMNYAYELKFVKVN